MLSPRNAWRCLGDFDIENSSIGHHRQAKIHPGTTKRDFPPPVKFWKRCQKLLPAAKTPSDPTRGYSGPNWRGSWRSRGRELLKSAGGREFGIQVRGRW